MTANAKTQKILHERLKILCHYFSADYVWHKECNGFLQYLAVRKRPRSENAKIYKKLIFEKFGWHESTITLH